MPVNVSPFHPPHSHSSSDLERFNASTSLHQVSHQPFHFTEQIAPASQLQSAAGPQALHASKCAPCRHQGPSGHGGDTLPLL